MAVLLLAVKSLKNRWFTTFLTIVSISLSIALFLSVERIRHEAQAGFTNTISGTDLIVGARTGQVQLLLASVFRLSDTSNNISWESYKSIAGTSQVKWAIPISLGDTHKGYRVLGTNENYYKHLQFGSKQHLSLEEGKWFADEHGAVIGAEIAKALGYSVGSEIVVSHGSGDISFINHEQHPFLVSGILKRTGTPVDQTVHISLTGIDEIHAEVTMAEGHQHDPLAGHLEYDGHSELGGAESPSISAIFLGLQSRRDVLAVQRSINEYQDEPLSAVIPAAALQELWRIVGTVEKSLLAISGFVVLVGLIGMMVAIMTSLNERRREMAILRAVGARPAHILGLIVGEAAIIATVGVILGIAALYGLLIVVRPIIETYLGLFMTICAPSLSEVAVVLSMCFAGVVIGLVPGYRIYRFSLADGMTVRL